MSKFRTEVSKILYDKRNDELLGVVIGQGVAAAQKGGSYTVVHKFEDAWYTIVTINWPKGDN